MKKKSIITCFALIGVAAVLTACGTNATNETAEDTVIDNTTESETAGTPDADATQDESEVSQATKDQAAKEAPSEDEDETKAVETASEETEDAEDDGSEEEPEDTKDDGSEEVNAGSHLYYWGIMEFEGDDSMVIEIETLGTPKQEDASIRFTVVDSIFDYKLFEKITCGDLLVDKDSNPEWANDGITNGIFGFIDDSFTLSPGDEPEEPFSVTFSDPVDGGIKDFTVTWNTDGTVNVSEGSLSEE